MRPTGIHQILRLAILSAAVVVAVSGLGGRTGSGVGEAQHQPKNQPPLPAQNNPDMLPPLDQPSVGPDPTRVRMEEARVKVMNDDRHKRLAADVDRLLSLTNELKLDVDKTDKDQLSVEVIRKAQEIEKLAHDVQSRMKN
jgi:hypothetical protein